jgi:mycofactocin system glycosyltransferase
MTGSAMTLAQDRRRPASRAGTPDPARPPLGPRYRLAEGLQLVPSIDGGTLHCLRPVMAMRLDPAGAALLRGLAAGESRTAADLASLVPDLSGGEAALFLETLARRRLLLRDFPPPQDWPSVSVIVAAHGRPEGTRACVQSLLALDYPRERIDITVVDDGSDPPLAPVLKGLPIRVMPLAHNVGQSAARNLAAVEAEGDLLAFIDNDCVATANWLRDLVPHFGDRDTVLVGGRITAPPSAKTVAAFEAVRSPLDMGPAGGPVGPGQAIAYLPTCNMIVRRDAFLSASGFATTMRVGEDVDLVWRILGQGGRGHYVAAGDVVHDHRVQLGPLLRRRADYGASEADLQRRHPDCGRVMHAPRAGALGLAAITLAIPAPVAGAAVAAVVCALIAAELAAKRRRLRGVGLALPTGELAASVMRGHAASLYHLGRDVTRYYGLPLAGAGSVWPALLPAMGILLLLPQACDYHRLKPALSFPVFAALSLLEMAAYQLGVWRGCAARRAWRPLIPSIRWRP